MLRVLLICVAFVCAFSDCFPQEEKDVESALKMFQKDKAKGIARMEKHMQGSTNSKYWDVLVKMYYEKHLATGSANDTSSESFNDFVKICRFASLRSRSSLASFFLRVLVVEKEPVLPAAIVQQFDVADALLKEKRYNDALLMYDKLAKSDTSLVKARLAMGNCYRLLKLPDSAVSCYMSLARAYPDNVDVWKGLVNAMVDKNDFVFVIEKAIYGLIAYPDEELYDMFYYILNKQHKALNRNWIPRRYAVNNYKGINDSIVEIPWNVYRNSKDEIKPHFNENGLLIRKNGYTKTKYAELYAWEQMLKRPECARISHFDVARRMQAAGYLDCYVLFSLYHVDNYAQYRAFASANRDRLKQYIETYLIAK